MNDPLALPFDQYQRYRLVADLLTKLRGQGARLSVLDVGGRTAVLRDFLPAERITLVDMEASDAKGLVLGDGSALPFADDAFDVVAAFDTLEHVPPARRAAFVAECARVSKRWVVLCGPYQHERVAEAERLLQRFLKEKLGAEHRYLDEHRHNGLPDRAATEAQLRTLGAQVASIGHANLERWLVLQCLSMYMDYEPALKRLSEPFQRFYNRALYESDHAEPVYRHALIAAFDGAPLPSARDLLGPPGAPAGTLQPFLELTSALLAFDSDRANWGAERDVLRVQAAELRADLEGHRASLADLRRESELEAAVIAEQRGLIEREHAAARAAIESLERDLAGHRKLVAELQSERAGLVRVVDDLKRERDALAAVRTELENHVAVQAASLAALSADLAGHRASLAATSADLEGHRTALAATRAELAVQGAAAKVLEAELREALSLASGFERSLADREVVYDELKAELSSRWRNFKRVFRPHR